MIQLTTFCLTPHTSEGTSGSPNNLFPTRPSSPSLYIYIWSHLKRRGFWLRERRRRFRRGKYICSCVIGYAEYGPNGCVDAELVHPGLLPFYLGGVCSGTVRPKELSNGIRWYPYAYPVRINHNPSMIVRLLASLCNYIKYTIVIVLAISHASRRRV